MTTTRTVGPLHFEDLEPHRFEDLVRQLIYDFRSWHSLEATGRLGADEGIDVRGIQRHLMQPVSIETDEDAQGAEAGIEERASEPAFLEREWRIQCKREKRIGPKRIDAICEDIIPDPSSKPYGLIVAAACDFSLKTRGVFRSRMLELGVEEFFLWGKGELEDFLFQPRNDHLLWAYFGISLRVRRKSQKAALTTRLATKRKLSKMLGSPGGFPEVHWVLVRDAEAEEYPWPSDPEAFLKEPRWRYYRFEGHVMADHLGFITLDAYAWLDREKMAWDYIEDSDSSWPDHPRLEGVSRPYDGKWQQRAHYFWLADVEKANQASLIEISILHYDQILAVDEDGDAHHEGPHLYVDFEGRSSPFRRARTFLRAGIGRREPLIPVEDFKRRRFFPKKLPERTWADVEAKREAQERRE